MNKYWLYILLLNIFFADAQTQTDTVVSPAEPIVEEVVYGEKVTPNKPVIAADSLAKDSLPITQKKFRTAYKENYTGTDFIYSYEKLAEKTWQDKLREWLRDFFDFDINANSSWMDVLWEVFKFSAIILFVLLLAWLIRYVIVNDIHLFFVKKPKAQVQVYDLEKNIHEVDFDQLIKDAVNNNEYRLTVRYHFLRLLKNMSAKNIIDWHPDKTNHEYKNELTRKDLSADFEYLAYIYENIWYGEFDIDQVKFDTIAQKFNHTISRLS